ncbi:MAG: phage holin family protein [Clostridia bacterium]
MELLSVPIIATLVFSIIEMIKLPFKSKPLFLNFVPLISGFLGAGFGVIMYYFVPSLIQTANVFTAIIVGMLSGLSATGSHQLVKQIKKTSADKNVLIGNLDEIDQEKDENQDKTNKAEQTGTKSTNEKEKAKKTTKNTTEK